MLQTDAWLDEKPYKEIYDGRLHLKVSPQHIHGIVQIVVGSLLLEWARERGDVVCEWRVFLDEKTSLVPDLSFISDELAATLSETELERPPLSPELIIEIRSPDDRNRNIRRKTQLYLQHGAVVVLNIDPQKRAVAVTTAEREQTLHAGDTFEHPAFPGLAVPVSSIFAPLDRRRAR